MLRSPLSLLLLAATLAPATASAGYDPCPSTDWAVSTLALEVEQAYIDQEALALRGALTDLREAVTCLQEGVSPATAAAVHRAMALVATAQGDEGTATAALQAALIAEPGWEPGPELAPPASDLSLTIDLARIERQPTRSTLTASRGLALRLDGAPSWRMADRLPVLMQLIDNEGHPVRSAYLLPGDPLPDGVQQSGGGDAQSARIPRERPEPRPARTPAPRGGGSSTTRVLLIGGTGALAATAVGLGVASANARADWQAAEERCAARVEGCSPYSERQIEDTQQQAKRLGRGAALAAAGSAALGVTLVLTW